MPPRGQPRGWPSSRNVYSCSMPNHMSWSAYFSARAAVADRVLETWGFMSMSSTSLSTRMLSPPRMGSGHTNTGLSTQSEEWPSAWLVDEPSKPQTGGSWPSSRILVLERSRGVGLVPSIQMYSALRSEEHTSELQSLMRISYAVFCLKKKNKHK